MKTKKKKILLIDDEKDFVETVKWNLEKTGKYTVSMETEPSHALAVAKVFKPDLIILDVMMPGMDGGDVERQVKEDEELKGTPIIFLTAIVREEETETDKGEIAGHVFLSKPVSLDKLVKYIDKYVRK